MFFPAQYIAPERKALMSAHMNHGLFCCKPAQFRGRPRLAPQCAQSPPLLGEREKTSGRARRLCRFALICLLASLLCACSLKSKIPEGGVAGASICETALSTVGAPYRLGGASPSRGFDCSGLVLWAYAKHGVKLPRTARDQSRVGKAVGQKALQKGDIVVFKTGSGVHTGIYTGGGKFVHSPSRGKTVREDKIHSKYWSKRFVSGRRV